MYIIITNSGLSGGLDDEPRVAIERKGKLVGWAETAPMIHGRLSRYRSVWNERLLLLLLLLLLMLPVMPWILLR
jgi:hypothetical protein